MKNIIRENRRYFIFLFLISIVDTILSLLVPAYINFFSNPSFSKEDMLTIILITVAGISVQLVLVYVKENFAYKQNIKEMNRLLTKVYLTKYDYIESKGIQYLVDLVAQSVINITMYINLNVISLFISILSILIAILIIYTISISISIILIVLIPLNYLGYKYLNKNLKIRSKNSQTGTSQGLQQIVTLSSPSENIKQYVSSNTYIGTLSKPIKTIFENLYEVNKYGQLGSYFLTNLNNLGRNIIYIILLFNFLFFDTTSFNMISISIILPLFFSSLNTIVHLNINSSSYQGALDFISELDDNMEDFTGINFVEIDEIKLDISALKLEDKDLPVKINEVISTGDFVEVVGLSGKGKSTLLKAIIGFRDQSGIYINGKENYLYSKQVLRSKIAYISQDAWVIEGTVLDNIKIGNDNIDQILLNDLEVVLKNSNVNYDTIIEEGGNNISTGEKQRISLLRTLCRDFDVLLIDEALSNLDIKSSKDIYAILKNKFKDKIVFTVSHDRSNTEFCNLSIKF